MYHIVCRQVGGMRASLFCITISTTDSKGNWRPHVITGVKVDHWVKLSLHCRINASARGGGGLEYKKGRGARRLA